MDGRVAVLDQKGVDEDKCGIGRERKAIIYEEI